jgi:ESS family glutamate:Na+ symporter
MGATFHGVIAFALMATLLLTGGVLRNRVGWLRSSLVPASIVAGVLGFILLSANLIPGFGPGDFTTLTFHFFTLSFMSLCLTGQPRGAGGSSAGIVRGGLWLTLIWSISLGLQGVVGYGVIAAYDSVTGADLSAFLGAIITHGFTQGPGQALTYGTIWESDYGIVNAAQVGLIYASLGFLVAFLAGVPVARYFIRRGLNANRASNIDASFTSGLFRREVAPESGRMVTHPGNMDSLAYHLALLGLAYVITYLYLTFMQGLVGDMSPGGIKIGVLFSYNLFFIHGLIVCLIIRAVIDRLGLSEWIDDDTFKRITGSSVDFMVVGTLMSVQFAVIYALMLPILLVTLAVTAVTALLCLLLVRATGPLGRERAVTCFGCCCGSTGTGLLLLRMMDADFSTTVPKELAFFNVAIVISTFPILFIIAPIAPSLGLWGFLAAYGGLALLFLLMIPVLMWRTNAGIQTQQTTSAYTAEQV